MKSVYRKSLEAHRQTIMLVSMILLGVFFSISLVSASFGYTNQQSGITLITTYIANGTLSTIDNNGDGTYTWIFSNGYNFTTGDLTGPQGLPGLNGSNGIDGVNGSQGIPGVDGINGTYQYILNDTQFINDTTTFSLSEIWLDTFVSAYDYITSWLIPDTSNGYLYNDSSSIYFNDTKLTENFAPIHYGDDWNKTYADTLYAVLGYGDIWNKTYADTLYSSINWNYNQTTGANSYTDTKIGTANLHTHSLNNLTSGTMQTTLALGVQNTTRNNNSYVYFGDGNNAYMYYNGTTLVIKVT